MTVVALCPIRDLEVAAARAKIAEAAHRSPSGDDCLGCDHCVELIEDTARTQQRLDAARSQQPARAIPTDAVRLRRLERVRGEQS